MWGVPERVCRIKELGVPVGIVKYNDWYSVPLPIGRNGSNWRLPLFDGKLDANAEAVSAVSSLSGR
ncbi:hypothetical protein JIR001_28030 [Polycladomyces abyssicola]|uniref:Uncharacterized protein n=1 Tax=Polycladomyces abyssicola TaxID=1125966 RepID=A0A8D5UJQ9_9BACL|nr:hypothetical protein JIR001_28030 [Polycladomyces abyssicola]